MQDDSEKVEKSLTGNSGNEYKYFLSNKWNANTLAHFETAAEQKLQRESFWDLSAEKEHTMHANVAWQRRNSRGKSKQICVTVNKKRRRLHCEFFPS